MLHSAMTQIRIMIPTLMLRLKASAGPRRRQRRTRSDSIETEQALRIKLTVFLSVWGVGILDAGEVQQHLRDRHIVAREYLGPNLEALGPAASAQGDDLPLGFIILSHE